MIIICGQFISYPWSKHFTTTASATDNDTIDNNVDDYIDSVNKNSCIKFFLKNTENLISNHTV